jgi:hypothetical protein
MVGGMGIDLPVLATPGTKAPLEQPLLGRRQPQPHGLAVAGRTEIDYSGVQQWPQRRMQCAQGEQSSGVCTWRRRWCMV